MAELSEKLAPYPNLAAIVGALLAEWPDHQKYVEKRFQNDDDAFLGRTEELAAVSMRSLEGELSLYVQDYRWVSERLLEEEIHFQREGRYRLSTFQEAYDEVYSNVDYMGRYMRGLMISQIIWDQHARAFDVFRQEFLATLAPDTSYLEIGPGHGIFLYFASLQSNITRLEAWDVSEGSIIETRDALKALGVTRDVSLVQQDILKAPERHNEFDAAVISEVLEHLERPDLALRSLHAALKPGGRIFIHVPINSPAPDHIYLWREIEEFHRFVEAQGFRIDIAHSLPVTGYTLERAIRRGVSISCILIATRIEA